MPRNTSYVSPSQNIAKAKKAFGERVRQWMNKKHWTQSELARRAGLRRDAVSTYIHGTTFPDPENLAKLAKALEVEPEMLIPSLSLKQEVSVNVSGTANGAVTVNAAQTPPEPTPPAPATHNEVELHLTAEGSYLKFDRFVTARQAAAILQILTEE